MFECSLYRRTLLAADICIGLLDKTYRIIKLASPNIQHHCRKFQRNAQHGQVSLAGKCRTL